MDEPATERSRGRKRHDVWHLDLTMIPTGGGFWMPWLPFARTQRWPFCWWAVVALDQASRAVMGFAVFKMRPDAHQVADFVRRAAWRRSSRPRSIVTDRGVGFTSKVFGRVCRSLGIRRRFGAVGHGSIAVIERFIRSMKAEGMDRILVPLRVGRMRRELGSYVAWYNEHRPHTGLGGRTPAEVMAGIRPGIERPRFEPRRLPPRRAVRPRGQPGARLEVVPKGVGGRRHLRVVELRRAG